jgi:zinc/manganese transport system substrate-binding protein
MMTRSNMLAAAAGVLAVLLFAATAAAQEKLKVVVTFSILGDFVKNVGGDRIEVTTLVGPDADAHVYSPAPADAKKVAEAKVVFVNGLGYEGWMSRLAKAAGSTAAVVVTTRGITERKAIGHSHGSGHGGADAHAWQSVANAKVYVANIRDALAAADSPGKAVYEANAATYLAKLDDLDREVRTAVAAIPAERRKIITNHEAFGYFKQDYGVDFIAPQGMSTEAEPSARDVARIITQIKRQKIPAVFLENITDARLMQRISQESGARIGGRLFSDALTDAKGAAPSYIEMMRHNLKTLTAALTM